MTALRRVIQNQLFDVDDERIRAIVTVSKLDGKTKKRPNLLCLAVTIEPPIDVRLYFVKEEKDGSFKKKERFDMREIREIDGINPKKASRKFHLTIGDRNYEILAGSSEEKEEFIRELYKLASQYSPSRMPDFFNMPIPRFETAEITFVGVETTDANENGNVSARSEDYQPISDKEDADFRKLMEKANLKVDEVHKFAEMLTEHLQSIDGDNIAAMMESETSVNQLLAGIEAALERADLVERELDSCDDILSVVRDSIELIEEKDTLSIVERRNQHVLNRELTEFVRELDVLTDAHLDALRKANFSDSASLKRCEEAARMVSEFWNGELSKKPLRQMNAFQKRNEETTDVVDVFADRLLSHLSALFSNLNDLSLDQEWHDLCIPKQSQRFRALFPLAELVDWLKTNRPKAHSIVIEKYVSSTNRLYKRLFDAFFGTLIGKVPRMKKEGTGKKSKVVDGPNNLSIRSTENQSFVSIPGELPPDSDILPELFETVLGELSTVISAEQRFLVRFFRLNSELSPSLLNGASSRSLRHVMDGLFESLNTHLDGFCRAVYRESSTSVLRLFDLISRKSLVSQDPADYFSTIFDSLSVSIKQQFDTLIDSECGQYSDIRIAKKTRPGVLASIERFARFVGHTDLIFRTAERRDDLEKAYSLMCRAVFEGIEKAAASSYKTPASVVKFENYHQLYLTLSELRIPCLDQQRKEAKTLKETHINEYVKEQMVRPLREIHTFFELVSDALESRRLREHAVSYEPQFSRSELRRVIAMHPGKEVKRGLEELYKHTEKQLVAGSSLLQVVWRQMQEQFMKQIFEYNNLIVRCYPGSRIELGVSTDDVLRFFSQIAQQH